MAKLLSNPNEASLFSQASQKPNAALFLIISSQLFLIAHVAFDLSRVFRCVSR
jgi:hypothetical protein